MSDKLLVVGALSLLIACQTGQSDQSLGLDLQDSVVAGNPNCADLGYGDTEAKVEDPNDGQSILALGDGEFVITYDLDSGEFSWTSTVGVDAVIVKGGPKANVYAYDPEATSDSGLHSPATPSGKWAAVSHISVCFDDDPDPCADVTCAPAPGECFEDGVCDPASGECVYAPKAAGTACSADDNACTDDVCDADGQCTHSAGNAGALCRDADGACDVPEYCDGESTECPADDFADSSMECRASAGDCDPAEYCSGYDADCPADELSPADMECRPSAGLCDPAEFCTGQDASCPADELADQGTVCRPSTEICDPAEVCTGDDAECPADV